MKINDSLKKQIRKLYYGLSPEWRLKLRKWIYLPVDLWDQVFRKKDSLVPPRGLMFIGPGNFVRIGDTFLEQFIRHCGLQPNAKVLDVGCGVGRIARPLTGYLHADGAYEGFDIVEEGIQWCRKAYLPFPQFHFRHIPLRNDLYNLTAAEQAEELRFPYDERRFDLVVLTSVFTHMQPAAVDHYLEEIARVLRPDGRCFCTMFVLTESTIHEMKMNGEAFFKYDFGHYWLHHPKVKDANIAYRIEYLESLFRKHGLFAQQHHPGWWSDQSRKDRLGFQDTLILARAKRS